MKVQVQLVNLGNTLLEGVSVTVPDVSDFACKAGASSVADADLTAAYDATAAVVAPAHKVVCVGSFTFDQAELDKDQSSKAFTPALTTTTTSTTAVTNSFVDSYGTTASISIGSVPAVVVSVDASACVIPSIIPSGASGAWATQCCFLACLTMLAQHACKIC